MSVDLDAMLERHEGVRLRAYRDSEGVWTIGIGHNLSKPLSRRAVQVIFEDDKADAINECFHAFPWYADLDADRQAVLVNMCFNLGLPRLQHFRLFLGAMEAGDYDRAAAEMLNSLWAKQVKGRAHELAAIIRGASHA